MKYVGPIYGKVGRKYVPLKQTSDEFDALERELVSVKLENQMMKNHNARLEELCFGAVDKLRKPERENAVLCERIGAARARLHGVRFRMAKDVLDILSNAQGDSQSHAKKL